MTDIAYGVQDARSRDADPRSALEERWPLRWSVVFVVVSSVGLWSAIITGISCII